MDIWVIFLDFSVILSFVFEFVLDFLAKVFNFTAISFGFLCDFFGFVGINFVGISFGISKTHFNIHTVDSTVRFTRIEAKAKPN